MLRINLSNMHLGLWTQLDSMIFFINIFLPKYKITKLKNKKEPRHLGLPTRPTCLGQKYFFLFLKEVYHYFLRNKQITYYLFFYRI
jgi:hypothetical protein